MIGIQLTMSEWYKTGITRTGNSCEMGWNERNQSCYMIHGNDIGNKASKREEYAIPYGPKILSFHRL